MSNSVVCFVYDKKKFLCLDCNLWRRFYIEIGELAVLSEKQEIKFEGLEVNFL